jgi:hypothetical protein
MPIQRRGLPSGLDVPDAFRRERMVASGIDASSLVTSGPEQIDQVISVWVPIQGDLTGNLAVVIRRRVFGFEYVFGEDRN